MGRVCGIVGRVDGGSLPGQVGFKSGHLVARLGVYGCLHTLGNGEAECDGGIVLVDERLERSGSVRWCSQARHVEGCELSEGAGAQVSES